MLDVIEEKSKLVDNQDELVAQTGSSTFPRKSIQLDYSSGTASKSKSAFLIRVSERGFSLLSQTGLGDLNEPSLFAFACSVVSFETRIQPFFRFNIRRSRKAY